MTQEEKYMKEAIRQAKKAAAVGDVPIGCVIVHEDKIIARAYNQRNKKKTTLAHAELLAIQKASKKLEDWRLRNVQCILHLNHVRFVQERLFRREFQRLLLEQ